MDDNENSIEKLLAESNFFVELQTSTVSTGNSTDAGRAISTWQCNELKCSEVLVCSMHVPEAPTVLVQRNLRLH